MLDILFLLICRVSANLQKPNSQSETDKFFVRTPGGISKRYRYKGFPKQKFSAQECFVNFTTFKCWAKHFDLRVFKFQFKKMALNRIAHQLNEVLNSHNFTYYQDGLRIIKTVYVLSRRVYVLSRRVLKSIFNQNLNVPLHISS